MPKTAKVDAKHDKAPCKDDSPAECIKKVVIANFIKALEEEFAAAENKLTYIIKIVQYDSLESKLLCRKIQI